MFIGIVFLVAAGVFGVMKFNDIFSDDSYLPQDNPRNQQLDDLNSEQQPIQAEEQTPPVEEEKPQAQNPKPAAPAAAGPTEGVGTLAWVVNKHCPLNPLSYVPPNLVYPNVKLRVPGNESMRIRADVGTAIEQLFAAAGGAGHDPMFSSGYRSYNYQASLYNNYVKNSGQAAADTYSARPGYSEHQTGLSFDICNAGNCQLQQSFANTPLGQWVAANAHSYGFTIRYKQNMQHVTGFIYEPWHLRYVGTDLATQLYHSGKTLEEHFGLPAAPSYL